MLYDFSCSIRRRTASRSDRSSGLLGVDGGSPGDDVG